MCIRDRIIPEPEGLFMGDLGVEEMKKYKDNNWYDWRIKHWNTKWNAYGFEPVSYTHLDVYKRQAFDAGHLNFKPFCDDIFGDG